MYLLWSLQQWRDEKKRNSTSLHIVSCDHNTRDNTKNEIRTVQAQCSKNSFHSEEYTGNVFTEQELRSRRHKTFIKECKKHKSKILILWHHLDDRIETTFLNINRGCGQEGIQWMKSQTTHFLDQTITIVRPLLSLKKIEIINEAQKKQIPYHNDPSNEDLDYSKRNKMRHLLQQEYNTDWFYKSLEQLYNIRDNTAPTNKINTIQTLLSQGKTYYLHQDTPKQYIITTKTGEWDSNLLYQLYHLLKISINPRSNTLDTLITMLNKKSGNKINYQHITIQSFHYSSVITLPTI